MTTFKSIYLYYKLVQLLRQNILLKNNTYRFRMCILGCGNPMRVELLIFILKKITISRTLYNFTITLGDKINERFLILLLFIFEFKKKIIFQRRMVTEISALVILKCSHEKSTPQIGSISIPYKGLVFLKNIIYYLYYRSLQLKYW